MSDVYVWIPNWDGADGFQHYRDRDPIWIKNYTRLLSHDEYTELTFTQRGILHGVWMEYARSSRRLRGDTSTLTRRLGQKVTRRDLDSLQQAGFIELIASDLLAARLAPCYPSRAPAPSQESETETDKELQELRTATTPTPNGNHTSGVQGLSGIQTEAELTRLLAWVGPDADTRTAAVLRHNWTNAPTAVRTHVLAALEQAHPRNRARWLVGTIKAETRKVAT